MKSLGRTFTGKTSHYAPDGYGRDWYILHDNGGVYKKGSTTGFSNERASPIREYSPPKPKMQAKFIRYSSDGSGRDAYINNNSGGLLYPYGSKPFYTTLRNWSPIKYNDLTDQHLRTQKQWLRKQPRKNPFQEELTSRLSIPKRRENHFSLAKTLLAPKRVPYPKKNYQTLDSSN